MKLFKPTYLLLILLSSILLQNGCKKQDEWLDVKRNKADVVPETITDFQAMMDNTSRLTYQIPIAGLIGTDNVYLTDALYPSVTETDRNLYLWKTDIWINGSSTDWNNCYSVLEYANIVLDGLAKISTTTPEYDNVKGQALFWRSISLYTLAQTFCKPYTQNTVGTDLGIPARTSSDVNIIFDRGTLKSTYEQIIQDLTMAVNLLPSSAKYKTRPSKYAALGLLARIYLGIEDYQNAYESSDAVIKANSTLLDYNSSLVSTSLTYRFPANGQNNPEVLMLILGNAYTTAWPSTASVGLVDPELFNSYDSNDLRKSLCYINVTGTNFYKTRGTYSGTNYIFNGIGLNEVYFIRAESLARIGRYNDGIADINTVLKYRYKTNTFTPITASNNDEALIKILSERRKELAFVGILRWEDLRRLNKDPKFAKTIKHTISGVTYELAPNDSKYVLPIPDNEIQITRLPQNPR